MIQNIELIDLNIFKPLKAAIVSANNDLSILSAKKAIKTMKLINKII